MASGGSNNSTALFPTSIDVRIETAEKDIIALKLRNKEKDEVEFEFLFILYA